MVGAATPAEARDLQAIDAIKSKSSLTWRAFHPGQSGQGSGLRPVFASDEAVIAERVDRGEDAVHSRAHRSWLIPLGNGGDLDMADPSGIRRLQAPGDVAMEDFAMIDVELQLDVGQPELRDQLDRPVQNR